MTRRRCQGSRQIATMATWSRSRAAGADYLVSGDRQLLDLADPEPPVLSPRQLLEMLDA
jgi:predicted nucleic acid-binding protein